MLNAGRTDERQRLHIFVIFKDCAHNALPRPKVTDQRINICVGLYCSVRDDRSEVFTSVALARWRR